MAHLLRMPAVSTSSTSATIVQWCLAEGDAFSQGDVIALAETEKAEVEIPAESEGVLIRTLVPEGTDVPSGEPVALLAAPSESVDDPDAVLNELGAGATAASPAPDPAPAKEPAAPAVEQPNRVFASPLARKMAKEAGLTVAELPGTGPGGRIIRRDVATAVAQRSSAPTTTNNGDEPPPTAAAGADGEQVPHTRMRRTIAARLSESFRDAPHFYLRAECRVDELTGLLEQVRTTTSAGVTITDLVVKAVAVAHAAVPQLNVIWTDDAVHRFTSVDIAIAIATDDGLVTGVLRDVASKSVSTIAAERAKLVGRARSGKLRADDVTGGSITVSNLGMTGVQEFTAVLNPPHAAILAVGAVMDRPVAVAGAVEVESTMTVVLSVDHRPVDGMAAARWLTEFVAIIDNPLRILA